jgi:hypothetical protein
MSRVAYFTSNNGFRAARGDALTALTGLPSWARMIVMLLAIPGIILIALSLAILAASVAALLILTVPAYSLLRSLTAAPARSPASADMKPTVEVIGRPTRRVDATVT